MKQTLITLALLLATMYGYCQKTDSLLNSTIQYAPLRITAGGQDGYKITWVAIEKDLKLVKNTLNLGFVGDYGFPSGNYTTFIAGVYLAPYVAVNRQILSNYEKQNEGLFVFAKIGYGGYEVKLPNAKAATTYGPIYGVGADYFITSEIGLTATGFFFTKSNEPAIIQGGVVFKIN